MSKHNRPMTVYRATAPSEIKRLAALVCVKHEPSPRHAAAIEQYLIEREARRAIARAKRAAKAAR